MIVAAAPVPTIVTESAMSWSPVLGVSSLMLGTSSS
jgi:hypothetical protein